MPSIDVIIQRLKEHFKVKTDAELSGELKRSSNYVSSMKNRKKIPVQTILKAVGINNLNKIIGNETGRSEASINAPQGGNVVESAQNTDHDEMVALRAKYGLLRELYDADKRNAAEFRNRVAAALENCEKAHQIGEPSKNVDTADHSMARAKGMTS